MISLYVNGDKVETAENITVLQLVESYQLDPRSILIERNGQALYRHEWDKLILQSEDRIELIRMVAGG